MVAVDKLARIRHWFVILDKLTDESSLVTPQDLVVGAALDKQPQDVEFPESKAADCYAGGMPAPRTSRSRLASSSSTLRSGSACSRSAVS
jgi:hypothetical protein